MMITPNIDCNAFLIWLFSTADNV